MLDVFKEKGKGPIKFKDYTFIGQHPDYNDIFYYVRELPLHNFDFLEAKCNVMGKKKATLTAGTSIKTMDTFMYHYLLNKVNKIKYNPTKFLEKTISSLEKEYGKEEIGFIRETYTNKLSKDISNLKDIKQAKAEGYDVLYVSDTALIDKKFSQVTVVLVKESTVEGFNIKRDYVSFKTFLFMTKPSYVKGESTEKYKVFNFPDVNICLDLFK